MAYYFQPSLSGLLVQALGALAMAALAVALYRTLPRPALKYWSIGWSTLFVSLIALYAASSVSADPELAPSYPTIRYFGHALYLLGEYVFGYLVIAGCRSYAGVSPPPRSERWLIVPAAAWCFWLAKWAGGNINLLFAVHTLIYPYLFFSALRILRGVKPGRHGAVGLSVMKLALMLLTIDYLHYAPLFATSSYQNLRVFDAYLTYAPLYDLLFQVVLMFGMVMSVAGQTQEDLEAANADLKRARDRVEAASRMDPLTETLNRRAFAHVLADRTRDGRTVGRGVVAVVDLDDLKVLNDRYGHAAGDAALQALSAALGTCAVDEDLLFRWGGDEFVLLLNDVPLSAAEARFDGFNGKLQRTDIPGADGPIDLRASVGLSEFSDPQTLEAAIARADQAMYRRKKTA